VTSAGEAVERLLAAAESGELDAICHSRGVRLLGVFGSAARPTHDREPSDLDIAVSFSGTPDTLALLDELVRITGFDKVDLAVIDGASPLLRAEAMVGRPLFEAEPGLYSTTQMAALAERRDTQWLRDLDLEALKR
jgi:predicted nucleotidyltransferase